MLKSTARHKVKIRHVEMGGGLPVVVQSMTDTLTADVDKTVTQIIELHEAGSEIVRLTVNDDDAAKAVPYIREGLEARGYNIPLVGDFHYNGHYLLTTYPDCAKMLDKYRINPGNVGFKEKRDRQFEMMIEAALKHDKPVRIGVNWGSLDQELLAQLLDKNAQSPKPKPLDHIEREAVIQSALQSCELAEKLGMRPDRLVISCKVSKVPDLIHLYKDLASRCSYALHLGLTEAGMGIKGTVSSAVALSPLLLEGIGDTIRVSLTPRPGEPRSQEVKICCEILQSLGLRNFAPSVTACPGCGRTTKVYFRELAQDIQTYFDTQLPLWKKQYPGVEDMKIAVMGCIVNGPGESKHANIGISLPGNNESPSAPVFVDGQKFKTLKGDDIAAQFKAIVLDYVEKRYGL